MFDKAFFQVLIFSKFNTQFLRMPSEFKSNYKRYF
jgi:hypothetical protein